MKNLTPFGKAVRKYRVDQGETQLEVAQAIGVSVAFLSALETGKKNVPDEVLTKIASHFNLTVTDTENLRRDAWISRKEVTINMQNINNRDRELVAGFARKFKENELTKEQLNTLRSIFNMEE